MKKIFLAITALFFCAAAFTGCKEEASYMGQIEQLRDSVLHNFAQVSGTTIEVKHSTMLNVVLIGPSLEEKTDAEKQQMTDKVSAMAQTIFKGTDVDKGVVLFSKQDIPDKDLDAAMAGKTFDMHLPH
ncbi:hypothetical protein ACTHGU_19005 [Chitinophagaceae bacterium MMS25-I14]